MAGMKHRCAQVYMDGRQAGVLEETQSGFRFTYDAQYLRKGPALFHTLPLRSEPFDRPRLHPCFENLVSEGWLRAMQSTMQRLDTDDRFGLLLANGRDLAGAVTVEPMEISDNE